MTLKIQPLPISLVAIGIKIAIVITNTPQFIPFFLNSVIILSVNGKNFNIITKIDAIITTDSMLAEGVCNYLNENQLSVPTLAFDSIKPKLDLTAYVDINTLELGRVSFKTILQIINDTKENRQICYRQLIPHRIIER